METAKIQIANIQEAKVETAEAVPKDGAAPSHSVAAQVAVGSGAMLHSSMARRRRT